MNYNMLDLILRVLRAGYAVALSTCTFRRSGGDEIAIYG